MGKTLRSALIAILLVAGYRYRGILQDPLQSVVARGAAILDPRVHAATGTPSPPHPALEIRDRFVQAQKRLVRVPDYLRCGQEYRIAQVLGVAGEKVLRVALGTWDGVSKGAPVLFGDAWIGTVVKVEAEESLVRLVSHPDFHAGAYVPQRDREGRPIRFCVSGTRDADHSLTIRFETVYEDLRAGSPVRTLPPEGAAAWSPRLGRLVRVRNQTTGSRGELRLLPHADLSSLLFVAVRCTGGVARKQAGGTRVVPSVTAGVIQSFDSAPFRCSLLIDRGSEDGLAEGAAVVWGGVLVGRISRLARDTSRVQIIPDPELTIVGTLAAASGQVTTESLAGIRCRFLPAGVLTRGRLSIVDRGGVAPAPGDYLLLTAPGGDGLPCGLPVALVTVESAADAVQTLRYRLLLDPKKLDRVESFTEASPATP